MFSTVEVHWEIGKYLYVMQLECKKYIHNLFSELVETVDQIYSVKNSNPGLKNRQNKVARNLFT